MVNFVAGHVPALTITTGKNKYIIGGKSGSDNPNWKGGITYCSKGYKMVYMPEHPYAVNCYVMAHRVAMEEAIGRFITPQEKVHHRGRQQA